MNKVLYIFIFLFVFAFTGCEGCKKTKPKPPKPDPVQRLVETPDFNQDTAYAFIEKQVGFGPRVPGTIAHANTADSLLAKLISYAGAENAFTQPARVLQFDGSFMNIINIIATVNPGVKQR